MKKTPTQKDARSLRLIHYSFGSASTEGDFTEIVTATPERWGVYAVWFPQAMKTADDLIANFQVVLPVLRAAYGRARN